MLTEVKLRELIRKAESATPGPWAVNPQDRVNVQDRAQNPHTVAVCSGPNDLADHQEANADYIAAANPTVVSELAKACLEMREVLKFYGEWNRSTVKPVGLGVGWWSIKVLGLR